MTKFRRSTIAIGVLCFGLGTLSPALAEVAEESARENGPGFLVEEITVTARKREESLQDTPISISAYTADGLDYRGVTQLNSVADFTPNLVFQNNPSFGGANNAAAIYIRGVGQKEFLPTVDPGVGLYVDGVYIARSVGAILDVVDFERVEVLRGPQGTLFGRNTIGGAINITTKKPDDVLSGRIEATGGSDYRGDLKASINLPISDRLFSKFTVASFNQDGYVERTDHKDLGDDETLTGRAAFRWLATDDLEINFSIDGTRDRENGPALTLMGINFASAVPPPGAPEDNFAAMHNFVTPGCSPPNSGDLNNPACYNEQWMIGDHKDSGTGPAYSDTDIWGTNLTVDWRVAGLDLKSITAYRDLRSKFARDGDHSPHTIVHFKDDLEQYQFTQELQLHGNSIDDRLAWIVGLYYFRESGDNVNLLNFLPVDFRSGGEFDNESLAAFAQGTLDITDQLSLTLGVRYTYESKEFKPDQIIFANRTGKPELDPGTRILPFKRVDDSIGETTPLVNLAYRWNDDFMTYGAFSQGFKSGGFIQRVFPPLPETTSFDPEFVDSYELGFKLTAFDRRLRLNAAAFYMKYDDLQIQVFNQVAPITKNAASADIKGFELELTSAPGDGWLIEAGVGYLDPEYKKINFSETLVNKSNDFERVSDWTLSAGVSKEFEIGGCGRITPRVDWSYRSKFYNDSFNTEQIAQDAYHLVNANLSWNSPDEKLTAIASVRNLTDEDYLVTGIFGASFNQYEGMFARGREYFLTLRYAF